MNRDTKAPPLDDVAYDGYRTVGVMLVPEPLREITDRTVGLVASRSAQPAGVVLVPPTKRGSLTCSVVDAGLTSFDVTHRTQRVFTANQMTPMKSRALLLAYPGFLAAPVTLASCVPVVSGRIDV